MFFQVLKYFSEKLALCSKFMANEVLERMIAERTLIYNCYKNPILFAFVNITANIPLFSINVYDIRKNLWFYKSCFYIEIRCFFNKI